MPTFHIAHIREQGQDMIIVPLAQDFGWKTQEEQSEIVDELQLRARSAGLAGHVVPVWDSGGGRMQFLAPHQWHTFFRSISPGQIRASLNRTLSW